MAQTYDDKLQVVGLGGVTFPSDTLELAKQFPAVPSATMVFHDSTEGWAPYGVLGQQTVILLDSDGNEITRARGLPNGFVQAIDQYEPEA